MAKPYQEVKIYEVQDRRSTAQAKLPWVVRYKIDGRHRSKSFRTKAEAERYRWLLLRAVQEGDYFDPGTGEPKSWYAPLAEMKVYEWTRRWASEQWVEWQPRTRRSAAEALARLAVLAVDEASDVPPGLRGYLQEKFGAGAGGELDERYERWLTRHSLTLGELDYERVSAIDRSLALKLDGSPLAATTANRFRIVSRACLLAAAELGALDRDVWPPRSRTRARRKVARTRRGIDVRALPGPASMAAAIEGMVNHQPGSRVYMVMTAVAYYAGLRPSEVVMLRRRSVDLPAIGWGRIDVTEADISFDEPGEPKTGPRSVPIPPKLVAILQDWVDHDAIAGPDGLLFRTQTGNLPTASNWRRAWHRSLRSRGLAPIRIYDCRHAAATTWLRAGVPLAETARRLGHSVNTLVSTYVGALDDEEEASNERLDLMLSSETSGRSGQRSR